MDQIPINTTLTAYYITTKTKGDPKKVSNSIIAISPAALDGRAIPEDQRIIMTCVAEGTYLQFMYFQ